MLRMGLFQLSRNTMVANVSDNLAGRIQERETEYIYIPLSLVWLLILYRINQSTEHLQVNPCTLSMSHSGVEIAR